MLFIILSIVSLVNRFVDRNDQIKYVCRTFKFYRLFINNSRKSLAKRFDYMLLSRGKFKSKRLILVAFTYKNAYNNLKMVKTGV